MKQLFRYASFSFIWILFVYCDCPPFGYSFEEIDDGINEAKHIALVNVTLVDLHMSCFEFEVLKVYKGSFIPGEIKTGELSNCGGGELKGRWIFFTNQEDYIDPFALCNYSFYVEKPQLLLPVGELDAQGNYVSMNVKNNWEAKNQALVDKLLYCLNDTKLCLRENPDTSTYW